MTTLRVIIGPRKQPIVDVDGVRMLAYPLIIRGADGYTALQDCADFQNLEEVDFRLTKLYLPLLFLKVRLIPSLRKAIIEFLKTFNAKQNIDFCCYSFAFLLNELDWRQPKGEVAEDMWSRIPYRVWKRKVGDVVLLVGASKHVAVYMGFNLFISVFGCGGDLEVATLKDMKVCFGTTKVLVLQLKQK